MDVLGTTVVAAPPPWETPSWAEPFHVLDWTINGEPLPELLGEGLHEGNTTPLRLGLADHSTVTWCCTSAHAAISTAGH